MLRFTRISPPSSTLLCIALACGILALHSGIVMALELMAACACVAWIAVRRYTSLQIKRSTIILCSMAMLCGALRYIQTRSAWQQAHAACLAHHQPLIITVIDIAAGKGSYPHVITARITEHAENPAAIRGWNILLYAMQSPTCCVSDACRIYTLRCAPIDSSTEYGLYLEKEQVIAVAFMQRCATHILERPQLSLRRGCWRLRNRVVDNLKKRMSPPVHALATSLVVGNGSLDRATLYQMRNAFNQWGIVHQLARSGLHIVILLALWQKGIGLLAHSMLLQQFMLLLLMLGYAALSLTTISFTRAVGSYAIATLALLGSRQQDALHSVAFIACTALLIQPLHLLALDFQLSFFLTAALAWSARITRAERRYH